jgi:hypothetical protein
MRPAARVLSAISVLIAMGPALTGCGRQLPPSRPPQAATVPATVERALGGAPLSAVSETQTGPYSVGLGLLGDARSVGETFTVLTWVSSESTQSRVLYGEKDWTLVDVVVRDAFGRTVFDEAQAKRMYRGGGPAVETIGGGQAFVRSVHVVLTGAGTYHVQGIATFRIRKPEATGNVFSGNQFDSYEATTPVIDVTIR